MIKEPLWTRDFILLYTIFFLVALVFFLLMVTMSTYASEVFNASVSLAGLVTGIFIIGGLTGRILSSRLIVKMDSKKILRVGLILFTFSSILYFFAWNISSLLLIRFFHGIATGITLNASATLVVLMIPFVRRAEGIGYFSTASIFSTALGPFLGILFIENKGLNFIFGFCLALSIIAILLSLKIEVLADKITDEHTHTSIPSTDFKRSKIALFLSDTFEITALPIAFVSLFTNFAYSSILSFIILYAKAIDLVWAASLYFLVYAITIILTRPFIGRLMDLRGANLVAYPTLLAYILGMVLLSQASHGIVLLIAAAVIGFGYGNINSIAQTISISKVSNARISTATTTFFVFMELGLGLGPYILGTFIPFAGFRIMYLLMAGLVTVATLLYYLFYGRTENLNDNESY